MSILTLTVAALSCCGAKKTETVTEKNLPVRLNLGQATFTEGEWKERFDDNAAWIKHLDPDRLLYWYRHYGGAGNADGVKPYPDWESGRLWYGITMGHYLSACAMYYGVTGEEWYKERVFETVDELEKCQKPNWLLFAMEEERFDTLRF